MPLSTLTAYTPIPANSLATTGLWDSRFQTLQKDVDQINIDVVQNLGTATTSTINAGSNVFTGTKEQKITSAIAAAVAQGAKYVFVPQSMLPYNASLVTFNTGVRMVAEGTNASVLETRSYGAALDGTTDDTAAVQATLNAAVSPGSIVMLSPGNSKCTAVLTVLGNCIVSGYGMGVSVITFPTNGLGAELRLDIVQVSNVSLRDFTLRETGVVARTGLYGLIRVTGATVADVKGTQPVNIRITRVEVDGSSGTGIMFQYVRDAVIGECFVHNGWADGIHVQRGSQDIIVRNNDCENNGDDDISFASHNFTQYGHVQACVAQNNRLGDGNATLNLGAGVAVWGAVGISIMGNLIRNSRKTGIILTDLDETGLSQGRSVPGRVIIVGNEIYNAGLSGVGTQDGIGGGNVREVLVADNIIYSPNVSGIHFNGSLIDLSVRGNRIRNCISGRGIDISPTNSTDSNLLALWTDALLTDGESKANVCGHRIAVQDNSVGTTWNDGIYLLASVGNPFDGLVCMGNEIWNSSKSNGVVKGLFVQYANDATINDNQVRAGYGGNIIQPIVLLNITKTGSPQIRNDVSVVVDSSTLVSGVDVSTADTFISTLTAARAVGAPFFPTNGQRISFILIQDGTGGRAVTWNAVFKITWSDAGNTLNKRSSISFIYDGTNWNQDGTQTPYV